MAYLKSFAVPAPAKVPDVVSKIIMVDNYVDTPEDVCQMAMENLTQQKPTFDVYFLETQFDDQWSITEDGSVFYMDEETHAAYVESSVRDGPDYEDRHSKQHWKRGAGTIDAVTQEGEPHTIWYASHVIRRFGPYVYGRVAFSIEYESTPSKFLHNPILVSSGEIINKTRKYLLANDTESHIQAVENILSLFGMKDDANILADNLVVYLPIFHPLCSKFSNIQLDHAYAFANCRAECEQRFKDDKLWNAIKVSYDPHIVFLSTLVAALCHQRRVLAHIHMISRDGVASALRARAPNKLITWRDTFVQYGAALIGRVHNFVAEKPVAAIGIVALILTATRSRSSLALTRALVPHRDAIAYRASSWPGSTHLETVAGMASPYISAIPSSLRDIVVSPVLEEVIKHTVPGSALILGLTESVLARDTPMEAFLRSCMHSFLSALPLPYAIAYHIWWNCLMEFTQGTMFLSGSKYCAQALRTIPWHQTMIMFGHRDQAVDVYSPTDLSGYQRFEKEYTEYAELTGNYVQYLPGTEKAFRIDAVHCYTSKPITPQKEGEDVKAKLNGEHVDDFDFIETAPTVGLYPVMWSACNMYRPATGPINTLGAVRFRQNAKLPNLYTANHERTDQLVRVYQTLARATVISFDQACSEQNYPVGIPPAAKRNLDADRERCAAEVDIEVNGFCKCNELLSPKIYDINGDQIRTIRPRMILNPSGGVSDALQADVRTLADTLKSVCGMGFEACRVGTAVYKGSELPIFFSYGAGRPASELERWYMVATTFTGAHLIQAGDDSLWVITGVDRFNLEGDATQFDASQGRALCDIMHDYFFAPFDRLHSTNMADLLLRLDGMRVSCRGRGRLAWSVSFTRNQPSQTTGSPATTPKNTLAGAGTNIAAMKTALDMSSGPQEVLHNYNKFMCDYGLTMKTKISPHPTILKMWFVPTLAGTLVAYPLPSMLCKFGKLMNNPCRIFKKDSPEVAYRKAAYALSTSLGPIDANYPLLGPAVAALKRLSLVTDYVLDTEHYRPVVVAAEIDREAAIGMMLDRYPALTREMIRLTEMMYNNVSQLPALVVAEAIQVLRAVDY